MRKLMWFTIGFGGACGFSAYLMNGDIPLALLIACLMGAALLLLLGDRAKWLRIASVILLGATTAFVWIGFLDWSYLNEAKALDGKAVEATLSARDYSYATDYGSAVDAELIHNGRTYQVRAYYSGDTPAFPGDNLSGTFRFRLTLKTDTREATYHQGKGIFLLAYGDETVTVTDGTAKPRDYPAILRQRLLTLIDDCFPEDTAFFARALLLGDGTGIDYETDTAFRISGIRHIIAVSGLHVTILFSLIYVLSGKRRGLTALLGIPILILFAAVAGFSASVTRACIMQILMILAMLFQKEYDPPTGLSFAALVMLIANPLVITDIGFQLSVGCMAGIFLFSARIQGWLSDPKRLGSGKGNGIMPRLKRWLISSVSVSLSAMSITTPLIAIHFGTVSLMGVVTNLLTLWMVTYIFYGIMLVCVAGVLWVPLGKILAWVVSWGVRYVLTVAKCLAKFPLAAVYTESGYIIAWLVFAYLLLAIFLLRRKSALTLICCITLGLCAALLSSWAEPMVNECRVTVLDVGQGQCVLLQSKGRSFLVDCGGDNDEAVADKAAETLLSQGITRLDGLILTHFDRDHAGGAEYFLSRIRADRIYFPPRLDDAGIGISLYQALKAETLAVEESTVLDYEDLKLTIFVPGIGKSDNKSGLCVLFQTENCDILIIGDQDISGERQLLKQTELPKLELLVVGHHGSKYSTGRELLEATLPETAVISVGDNSYGHPAQEVLDRLTAYGCQVYRTDQQGTIVFRR